MKVIGSVIVPYRVHISTSRLVPCTMRNLTIVLAAFAIRGAGAFAPRGSPLALSRSSVVCEAILDDITSAINEQRKPTTKKEPKKQKAGLPTPPALLILSKIPEKGSKVAQVAAAKNTIGVFAKPVNQVTGVKLEGLLGE